MEFLENAIFSTDSLSLLGAKITSYRPEIYTSRAEVKLFTLSDLRARYSELDPRGFSIGADGTFMSDTPARYVIADSVFPYMEAECQRQNQRQVDVTDVVLHGVTAKGFVVVDYEDVAEDETPILIPFKNFKVSKSSFNIYSSFQNREGKYRTFSLLDIREGGPKSFYCAFPEDYSLDAVADGLEFTGTMSHEGMDYDVYKCELGLATFYASVGEAFLNYLAYNVAFYNIGEKLLQGLLETYLPKEKPVYTSSSEERYERIPHKNIAIDHIYTECRLREFAECANDSEGMLSLISKYPEATVTYQWMQKVKTSPWFADVLKEQGIEEAYVVSCINLLQECKRDRLKCALELLTHRYFILSQGIANDNLGLVLKGGGVDGESVKQSNFWYS